MLQASGISPRFLALLDKEPLADLCVLDVGTGWGRLALALAPACRRVVGVDRDAASIDEARRRARRAGLDNVEFIVADAESVEYAAFEPDLVTAHLCMSDAIAERAARVLRPGQVFAAVAFHTDQWRETGRRSRFAYDERRMATLLGGLGFEVEHLAVEQEVETFPSVEAALAAVAGLEERWRSDGRWFQYLTFLEAGGRTLTRSHLVVKARRR
ncbi:MAG: class I SAM-dependent methyltransferase [Candidatus Rokubacteria bacterium]|nr:class I SAM-dependent methyltransferase [Candidatus Rokubacteria bacterium]